MKQRLRELIHRAVKELYNLDDTDLQGVLVSIPPAAVTEDYATNAALALAKKLEMNPLEITKQLAEKVRQLDGANGRPHLFTRNVIAGGFLNFELNPATWFPEVLKQIEEQHEEYGTSALLNQERVVLEYLSPNTNKPLHLGHIRNGVIGVAVSNILKSQNHEVIKVGIINDRGVHICKAMLAYQKWGKGTTPQSVGVKPDHFVGDWYVRFAKEAEKDQSLELQAQEMLQQWEAGDSEVRKLWDQMRQWVLDGWKETEAVLGFSYDKAYFESQVYSKGKDLVEKGLAKGVLSKNEKGNVVFNLPAEFGTDEQGNSRVITLLRPDGTSLYTTQDLGLAVARAEEFNADRMVYVVGSEQRFHFESLFAILKAFGYEWASKLRHLWYGMVYLPQGKMKSREGTVVDADDLVKEMEQLARQAMENRTDRANKTHAEHLEGSASALDIALAAIKFYFLRQKANTDIHFDPKESLSFEGFTGPYIQYTHARSKSMLREAAKQALDMEGNKAFVELGSTDERALVRLLENYPETIRQSATELDPSIVATYIFKIAQGFNQFYSSSPVLKAEPEVARARLALVAATAQVLKNGLELLGIRAPERM